MTPKDGRRGRIKGSIGPELNQTGTTRGIFLLPSATLLKSSSNQLFTIYKLGGTVGASQKGLITLAEQRDRRKAACDATMSSSNPSTVDWLKPRNDGKVSSFCRVWSS
ncbi:hypothetical protein CRG98_002598 [Punica granatum]|uniref:Uncharacterized protein n=1 Tax=Punica granatum TaxID=22663 RepID=A0A2I0L8R9_PUNGR|nr:hypothetical protein CRG98_002598 [Punica granatum]